MGGEALVYVAETARRILPNCRKGRTPLKNQRRIRMYWIDAYDILALFSWDRVQTVSLPILTTPPPGHVILGVASDFQTGCILFRVQHDSFDEVPVGMEPPKIQTEIRRVVMFKDGDKVTRE